jgi:hypothetical protein
LSELYQRVTDDDPDFAMPPESAGKRPLSDSEIAILRRWIEEGAKYEAHWSFVAPEKPVLPTVADPDWVINEIDQFVLAKLEGRGIVPSDEANNATLLRRLFLDLTGLPPLPSELEAFIGEESPQAYERWVDRLLSEEPWRSRVAEHLASGWLDAARYADTSGIHTDNGRQMWLWRDWVLRAFRDYMPYDAFLTAQLAGDLIPDGSQDDLIASGFNRNHVTTDEGGAIPAEYLVEYAVDRLNTTSTVFLGLTMGCARCHDHKFDPITQSDYYGMMAFFNSIDEPGLYTQTADANRAYEPFIEVPDAAQAKALGRLDSRMAELTGLMSTVHPDDAAKRNSFVQDVAQQTGVTWEIGQPLSVKSSEADVKLEVLPQGVIQASGPMPPFEDYTITLSAERSDLRFVLLEAMLNEGKGPGAGRAEHGNAVLSTVHLEAKPRAGAGDWQAVPIRWAWSDHTQQNGDFGPTNILDPDKRLGWSVDGNEAAGSRLLLLMAERSFGFSGGTLLRATLSFRSSFSHHSLGRIRLRLGSMQAASLSRLPVTLGRWYRTGPFTTLKRAEAFDAGVGPESTFALALDKNFGSGNLYWTFDESLVDSQVTDLFDGVGSIFVARSIYSPDARSLSLSLGSDDGFRLYLNGEEVASRRVDRGAEADQDRAVLQLRAGHNWLVFRIVNTGGPSAYYFRADEPEPVLSGSLVASLLPTESLSAEQSDKLTHAWRRRFSPDYREWSDSLLEVQSSRRALLRAIPRTMIMRERESPVPTYVLRRGLYDQPDLDRKVERDVPSCLGEFPDELPRNRFGLARWMTSPRNPIVARVAVNRFWSLLFGAGIVRTGENFGLQGAWPTHPELLDWLAVDFREHGWDVHRLLRKIVTSRTYRQRSVIRPSVAAHDPENRLLAYYPRRRLSAEQIRDLALYASGLLVERFGGPSVKTYQPPGIWREVAMLASNTREFTRGDGDDLWRRSVYTYWKRAAPPPSLQTLDAPTREACVVLRTRTNTPLQALVLLNDEQFLEAARVLAERTCLESEDDTRRLSLIYLRCLGRAPTPEERTLLLEHLGQFRKRYRQSSADAERLIHIGQHELRAAAPAPEIAAWTLLVSTVMNLHETLTQD